jgi:hypothetical protein
MQAEPRQRESVRFTVVGSIDREEVGLHHVHVTHQVSNKIGNASTLKSAENSHRVEKSQKKG